MKATEAQLKKIGLTLRGRQLYSPMWSFNEWIYKIADSDTGRQTLSSMIEMLDSSDDELRFYFKSLGFDPSEKVAGL